MSLKSYKKRGRGHNDNQIADKCIHTQNIEASHVFMHMTCQRRPRLTAPQSANRNIYEPHMKLSLKPYKQGRLVTRTNKLLDNAMILKKWKRHMICRRSPRLTAPRFVKCNIWSHI